MSPGFDDLAKQTFSAVTDLMGENAVWHSSTGANVEGRILFKNPTEPVQIGDTEKYEYRPNITTAEYYKGVFTGLKESTDEQNPEYIEIRGNMYSVTEVTTKFDGETYIAHLQPHKN